MEGGNFYQCDPCRNEKGEYFFVKSNQILKYSKNFQPLDSYNPSKHLIRQIMFRNHS